ncbi:MAG: putative glycoside hydrolase family 15 protein, partial [Verrucomicrobiae bacterium]|nr:putative glycoside hydrolase family 15 protein [Verrucomicrobiae bacterium]
AASDVYKRQVLTFVREVCLKPRLYDGVMLDCLWHDPPAEMDVNRDGRLDPSDGAVWRDGMVGLLVTLRAEFPNAILVGNGGLPWPGECPYYEFANGCMHENALGDHFGGPDWAVLWDSYRRAVSRSKRHPVVQLVQVDVRADGRSLKDALRLRSLTRQDLRRFRLGYATTLLLDGGYFGFDRGDCLHGQLWWFDMYDYDLGKPLETYREGELGPGLLSRRFEHGIVFVNPTDKSVAIDGRAVSVARDVRAGKEMLVIPARDAVLIYQPQRR